MQQDLFGEESQPRSQQTKKAVATKKKLVIIQELQSNDMAGRGLNAVYATGDFGGWIVKNRGNKTIE